METLMTLEPITVAGLDRLVRANLDSAAALHDAAEVVEGELLARVLDRVGRERRGFAEELSAYMDLNDVAPPEGGGWLESVRRVWCELRARLVGGDPGVVLTRMERVESTLMRVYEQVLKETAGSPVNATLMRHCAAIKRTRDALDELRCAAA